MRILRLALPIFMLTYACLIQAQDTTDIYSGIPDAVIESIGKKDIKGMFKAMNKSANFENKPDEPNPALESFIKQLEEQFNDTGDFLDASLYREDRLGTRYSILNYILNYGNKPMGMKIHMYNGKNGWRATNVNFIQDMEKFASEMHAEQKKK